MTIYAVGNCGYIASSLHYLSKSLNGNSWRFIDARKIHDKIISLDFVKDSDLIILLAGINRSKIFQNLKFRNTIEYSFARIVSNSRGTVVILSSADVYENRYSTIYSEDSQLKTLEVDPYAAFKIEHEVDSILNVPRLIVLRLPRVWGGPFDKDSFFAVSSSQIGTGGTLKINHRNPLRSFLHINQLYNSINCINVTHNNRTPKFFQIYNLADSTPSNLVQWISRVGIANEYRFQNMDQDRNISFGLNVSKFERDFGPIMPLNKIQALWV